MEITCNICLFTSPKPMKASCGHVFCWPCLYRMLDSPPAIPGQAKPCPACPTITVPEDEAIVSVVPGSRTVPTETEPTPDLADEDDITDRTTAYSQLPDLPPSHDAHVLENGLDQISKDETVDSLTDNFQGEEIRRGVISRTWKFFSTRYGSAIDEYLAIHRDLVDDWMSVEVAPPAAPNIPE